MGTTASGIVLVGGQIVVAHIGDSRIYRLRGGTLEQITADHTFVQRLVDSGRITPEEAAVHPRRSVLMRVLGDVDAAPEIDTKVLDTRPGDRWLLCSDGLSSYVSDERIAAALQSTTSAQAAADRLVKDSLDHGAPDNVTVIVVDIGDSDDPAPQHLFVGSAAAPLSFEGESARRPIRLPTLLLHPLKASQPEDAHFEPEREGYLEELIQEDRRRAMRRRITWLVVVVLAIAVIVTTVVVGYQWTQSRYYVGVDHGRVAVFRGVQQNIGPIHLSSVYQTTTIEVADLPAFYRESVRNTLGADDLRDALAIVDRLSNQAGDQQ
ncbi:hypothetical protein GCM10025881_19600 [Pseudolysinimonas kribbensis]|uniref:PPM-type phosphatase domain-containing protein n=2 Tax=Pseudolysinimonas kribbensis TaxID=433641 RepID=A0ABQ6K8R4_9MICO|nr:hypothetical protein GCM10025881_19600 [Pseudolysinimonas kribbensis]